MQIEIVCVGADLYAPIESAIRTLNAIQAEFIFRTAPESLRAEQMAFVRETYETPELFDLLKVYREKRDAGDDLFLFAFVDKHLNGTEFRNIFGAWSEPNKAAVATINQHKKYARDVRRFCSYYLLRYALSFCNFSVKGHDRKTDKDCYFHLKVRKSDIALSMMSGRICDECRRQLNLSGAQAIAFKNIADYIRGEYPHALVMKGGGAKALAYAGALRELEKQFKFDAYVGTSAGAMAAVLLAAGNTPAQLASTLERTNFNEFLDRMWRWPLNLLRGGVHSGDPFRNWVKTQLSARINKQGAICLEDLPLQAILYACSSGLGTIVFDSKGKRKEADAAYAVRRSMSIPFFFVPEEFEGFSVYDGGLRHNFPVSRFVADHPTKPFVALYLQSTREPKRRWFKLLELYDLWMEGDEREVVDSYADAVAVIDPSPIGTTDFALSGTEKELLIETGRLAALILIRDRNMEDAAPADTIEKLRQTVDLLRAKVVNERRSKAKRRFLLWGLGALALYFLW